MLALEILDTRAYALFAPVGLQALHVVSHINRLVTWSSVLSSVSMVLYGEALGTHPTQRLWLTSRVDAPGRRPLGTRCKKLLNTVNSHHASARASNHVL